MSGEARSSGRQEATASPARRSWPTGRPPIAPELIALAQGGSGIAIAVAGETGAPILGLGVGCRVMPGGLFRILLGGEANAALIAAIEKGRPIAVTITATRDHTSFQVKASRARCTAACSDDLPEIDRQNALFQDGLVEIGYSRDQAAGYAAHDPTDLAAIELVPERVFTQTPGPGAGTELPR